MDNALRWPVAGPGRTVYLSSGQRATLSIVASLAGRHRTFTLAELAAWSGTPSRGRAHDRLARLRQLGLVGFSAVRGRTGRIRAWIRRDLRAGVGWRRFRARSINDSVSPYGGFLTRGRVRPGAHERGNPPGSGGHGPLAGPRRGRRPPRVLWAKCPAGHTVTTGRRSWTDRDGVITAEYRGVCRRCGSPVLEALRLAIVTPARALSPAELTDSRLLADRRALAAAIAADPDTPAIVREQLRRDYLERPATLDIPGAGSARGAGPAPGSYRRIAWQDVPQLRRT